MKRKIIEVEQIIASPWFHRSPRKGGSLKIRSSAGRPQ